VETSGHENRFQENLLVVNASSFENLSALLTNHEALLSTKLDELGFNNELHNPGALAFTTDVINACDEFTQSSRSLNGICFHRLKPKVEAGTMTWGLNPMETNMLPR